MTIIPETEKAPIPPKIIASLPAGDVSAPSVIDSEQAAAPAVPNEPTAEQANDPLPPSTIPPV